MCLYVLLFHHPLSWATSPPWKHGSVLSTALNTRYAEHESCRIGFKWLFYNVSGLISLSDTPSLHISEQECADWELSQCAKLSGLEAALVEIPFTSGQQEQASWLNVPLYLHVAEWHKPEAAPCFWPDLSSWPFVPEASMQQIPSPYTRTTPFAALGTHMCPRDH